MEVLGLVEVVEQVDIDVRKFQFVAIHPIQLQLVVVEQEEQEVVELVKQEPLELIHLRFVILLTVEVVVEVLKQLHML